MWIGDVGQNAWEEVDFAAGRLAGPELGLGPARGQARVQRRTAPAGDVDPIYDYAHSGSVCAVTGGYVYRGSRLAGWGGVYLFADYCVGKVMALTRNGTSASVRDTGMSTSQIARSAKTATARSTSCPAREGSTASTRHEALVGDLALLLAACSSADDGTVTSTSSTSASTTSTVATTTTLDEVSAATRACVDAETAVRDPATPDIVRAGREQQVAYRMLVEHPEWLDRVLGRGVRPHFATAIRANVTAGQKLRSLSPPKNPAPPTTWRIVEPAPAE